MLVVEMVLSPGVLFLGGTAFVAYQVRGSPVALSLLAIATLFSVAVGIRQWGVMLRAVFPQTRGRRPPESLGEDSPRLTGRGGT